MLGVDGQLAARRAPDETLDADQVAEIEQPQQRQVVRDAVVRGEKTWILPVASCRSMNMPLLRYARMRPATAHPVAGFRPGRGCRRSAGVEFGGLMLAREADRVRVDAHITQRFELVEPHPAERIVGLTARAVESGELSSAVMRT